jgi:hypothetical protein
MMIFKVAGSLINRILNPIGLEIRRLSPLNIPQLDYNEITRFSYFKRIFDLVNDAEGDIVECGVGHGISLLYFAFLVKNEMKGRKVWGFDSFEGFPEYSEKDNINHKKRKGGWKDTSVWGVRNLLITSGLDANFIDSQITLVKGFFNDSLPKYRGSGIALLHLDVDLYDSYLTSLEELYPKVNVGGAVLFDEYLGTRDHLKFPGAQRAIDEYFGENKSQILRDKITGKYYLIKK